MEPTTLTWKYYIETEPVRGGAPVKLDRILAERMKAFIASRKKR